MKGVVKNLPIECLPIATRIIEKQRCKEEETGSNFLEISWVATLLQSEFGQQALSKCSTPLVSMNETLQHLLKSIDDASSAVEKVEVFSQIHLLTKTLLPLIKLHLNNARSNQHIRDILHTLTRALNAKGLPQEALGNCSNILVTHIFNSCDDWFEIIRAKLRDEDPPTPSLLDEINTLAVTKLSLCLAVLASLDCTSLLLEKRNEETVLGGTILQFIQQSYEGYYSLLIIRLNVEA